MLRFLVLYTALSLGANVAAAADLEALKAGQMEGLVVYSEPLPVPGFEFATAGGEPTSLEAWRGKVVVLNFWATWCPPCREEMPSLNNLQKTLGGKDFQVITLATGRNPPPKVDAFFEEAGLDALPKLYDEKQVGARALGALGLPVTLLLDREGREVARLIGGAEWDSPEALRIVEALIAQ